MQFNVLGPLTVLQDGRPVPLGGTRQRATLGFLLLQDNQVVATSRLLRALWPEDDMPVSGRKILQNAIWSLRGLLAGNGFGKDGSAVLMTRAPGYMLRVDAEQVDLRRFTRRVAEGRARLTSGEPDAAARVLREALTLWQGPALADLVEAGINWPELVSVQNSRLDAMEELFDAELACGRHHAVLGELETFVESEILRERSCGQLMLALYRCGRQADALNVFSRARTALVELGLEPGRRLQALQHAILTHDASLSFPDRAVPSGERPQVVLAARAVRQAVPENTVPAPRNGELARHRLSVLMVRRRMVEPGAGYPSIDDALDAFTQTIRQEVEARGGTFLASLGSTVVAVFGTSSDEDNHAVEAVLAGMGVLESDGLGSVHVAVATGEAIVRLQRPSAAGVPAVSGAVLDRCQRLLDAVPAGEIWTCESTFRATEGRFHYRAQGDAFVVVARRGAVLDPDEKGHPVANHDWEMRLLRSMLGRVRHQARPHLMTILGGEGLGKSRFLAEFAQWARARGDGTRVLAAQFPSWPEYNPLAVPAGILTSFCGIGPADTPAVADGKLADAVARLVPTPEERHWLTCMLQPLVAVGVGTRRLRLPSADLLRAWRLIIEEIARERPLVLVLDDAHAAPDTVLDTLECLVESSRFVRLLVVAAARPDLVVRRPGWGCGKEHTATVTLAHPDADVEWQGETGRPVGTLASPHPAPPGAALLG